MVKLRLIKKKSIEGKSKKEPVAPGTSQSSAAAERKEVKKRAKREIEEERQAEAKTLNRYYEASKYRFHHPAYDALSGLSGSVHLVGYKVCDDIFVEAIKTRLPPNLNIREDMIVTTHYYGKGGIKTTPTPPIADHIAHVQDIEVFEHFMKAKFLCEDKWYWIILALSPGYSPQKIKELRPLGEVVKKEDYEENVYPNVKCQTLVRRY